MCPGQGSASPNLCLAGKGAEAVSSALNRNADHHFQRLSRFFCPAAEGLIGYGEESSDINAKL